MKRALIVATIAACSIPLSAAAQTPTPQHSFTGNVGLFSDYSFRGVTQTDYEPAFQGGFDYAHASGFYLGNWNSNVSSVLYNGASLEMDFYGGYKATFGDFGFDVGLIYYYFPGTGKYSPDFKAKNYEGYIGGSYGPVSLKYFYSFSDFFGLNSNAVGLTPTIGSVDTKGSQYLDLSASFDLGSGWGVNGHVGWQKVKNLVALGGTDDQAIDYRVGVTYTVDGWVFGLAGVGGDPKDFFLTTEGEAGAKFRAIASVQKSF